MPLKNWSKVVKRVFKSLTFNFLKEAQIPWNLKQNLLNRIARHRRVDGPEVLDDGEMEPEEEMDEDSEEDYPSRRHRHVIHRMEAEESSSDEEEELDEDEIERRRAMMRDRAKVRVVREDEELLGVEEDDKSDKEAADEDDEEASSEYEEYTDSEEESGPRLKPVFVARLVSERSGPNFMALLTTEFFSCTASTKFLR